MWIPLRPAEGGRFVLILSCGLLALSAHADSPNSSEPSSDLSERRVGVLRFVVDLEGDSRRRALLAGPPSQQLAESLALRPGLSVLPPEALDFEDDRNPEADAVRQLARRRSLDAVAAGRLAAGDDGRVTLSLRLLSGRTGEPTASERWLVDASALDEQWRDFALWIDRSLRGATTGDGAASSFPRRSDRVSGRASDRVPEMSPDSSTTSQPLFAFGGLDDDQPIEIHSDVLELLSMRGDSERHLVFRGSVRVTQGSVTLRSDELEAFYAARDQQPRQLIARGNVRLHQGERRARCDRAVYLREQQSLTCEGRAELEAGCDIVRGRRMRFDLARDRAQVDGQASVVLGSRVDRSCSGSGQ